MTIYTLSQIKDGTGFAKRAQFVLLDDVLLHTLEHAPRVLAALNGLHDAVVHHGTLDTEQANDQWSTSFRAVLAALKYANMVGAEAKAKG